MKKKILLFTGAALIAVMALTSGKNGAGHEAGYNCTGSETGLGNAKGCSSTGASCHGTAGSPTPGITVAVELDSAGIPTTHYKAGKTYTVKITGVNTTSNVLPKFGFQVSCIKGSDSVTTPVNAGTFASTGLPTNVRYTGAILTPTAFFAANLVEHSDPITATSGAGGSGTTYAESFSWTAPAAATGTISFWAALNAVDGDDHAGATDKWNTAKAVISEWPSYLSIAETAPAFSIKAFPNPVSSNLNVQIDNAATDSYTLYIFSLDGKIISNERAEVSGNNPMISIGTAGWTPGIYELVAAGGGNQQVIPIVKQ
jgi:type IX secretion system substrate protein